MKQVKKYIALMVAAAMLIGIAVPEAGIYAAAKPKLSKKSVKIEVGAKKKVTVKKATGCKITVKSKKKAIATAKKKGNTAFVVTGVKAGKTTIVCTVKKGKKKIATLKCGVTVSEKEAAPATNNQTPSNQTGQTATQAPTGNNNQQAAPTPEPTIGPFPKLDKYTDLPLRYDETKEFVPMGTTENLTYESSALGGDRNAKVMLPAGYSKDEKYPVLYLFHGDGDSADSWGRMFSDNIIANATAFKLAKKMIVVMPNLKGASDEDVIKDFASDLMPAIEEKYSVAKGRVNTAVGGYDAGGRIALEIGKTLGDKVAYFGAFAPTDGADLSDFSVPDDSKDQYFIMIEKGNAGASYNSTLGSKGFECLYIELNGLTGIELYKGGLYNYVRRIFKRGTDDEGVSNGFVTEYTNSFPNAAAGKIEKVYYETETYDDKMIDGESSVKMTKYANVYLPAGYDPNKQYNVFYLMHGGGENAETWIVGDKETNPQGYGDYTNNQSMLNYLFETGYCEPCIIVNPTFYRPNGVDTPSSSRTYLTEVFKYELRNDLIPAIESKYSTYCNGDVSEANLIATRMHRGFAGLSMGSATTYESAFYSNYDIFAWFAPYSGMFTQADAYDAEVDKFIKVIEDGEKNGMPLGFFYCGNGTADIAFAAQWAVMQRALVKSDSLVDGKNFHFVLIDGAEHNMWQWHVHLYNTLKIFFTKE